MTASQEPLWDRTLRRVQNIWPRGASSVLKNGFAADLPESELSRLRKIINRCLEEKGGEVSARFRAAELGKAYLALSATGRRRFLDVLAREYDVDSDAVEEGIERIRNAADPDELQQATIALRNVLEPPRAKLLRQFNTLEEGVKFLVDLRSELISWARESSGLKALDLDLYRLLNSWFDVGFLDLQQITWKTPAAVLEKLINYEAVHKIDSWQDLKHRLEDDRLCYAFFHSRMPDEPLIFVEIALVNGISGNIGELLDRTAPSRDPAKADTAIFYSISNCQKGLAGVSFGNFLIKRVVADMAAKMPNLKQFCTLSPVPGFMKWLQQYNDSGELGKNEAAVLHFIQEDGLDTDVLRMIINEEASVADKNLDKELKQAMLRLCSHYLVREKRGGRAHDPVANFHLTNGARLERINWAADLSDNGLRNSVGIMVNYLYDLPDIERNHESYRSNGEVVISSSVRKMLR